MRLNLLFRIFFCFCIGVSCPMAGLLFSAHNFIKNRYGYRQTRLVCTGFDSESGLLSLPSMLEMEIEVPVYFSKAKQGYSVRKMERDK
jgi:hypothetical protein